MGRKCVWTLHENGGTKEFDSYSELTSYIAANLSDSVDKETDITFSLGDSKGQAVDLLKRIKKTTRLKRTKYSRVEDEIYDSPEDTNFIEIHEFIETEKQINGSPLVIQLNTNELTKRLVDQIESDKGVSKEIARGEVDKLFKYWERQETRGYYMHMLINAFFNGNQSTDALKHFIEVHIPAEHQAEYLKPEILNLLISSLQEIRNQIFRDRGSDCTIMSNIPITSKINGNDKELYANIDLVAIDNQGIPHVYIFATSDKIDSEQAGIKRLKRDYRLGIISQMLAQHGFNVKKSSLNVVPIQLSEGSDGLLSRVGFESPQDRRLTMRSDGTNRLQYGSGDVWKNINYLIPVTINESSFRGTIYNKVRKKLNNLFPTHNIIQDEESRAVTYFIRDHVIPSSMPGAAWEYETHSGETVYIVDDSPKETNAELRRRVAGELDIRKRASTSQQEYFLSGIRKAINDNMALHNIVIGNNTGAGRIELALSRYINGDWEYKSLPKLEELGIAAIQHKRTGQIDFIILTSTFDLSRQINLGLGTSILGSFLKDHQVNDKVHLKATSGNIKLIELLCTLDECADDFSDWKLGDIRVMNINQGETINVQIENVIEDYKLLCKKAGEDTKIHQLERQFIPPLEILKGRVLSTLQVLSLTDRTTFSGYLSELEGLSVFNKKAIKEECMKIMQQMQEKYSFLRGGFNKAMIEKGSSGNGHDIQILMLYITVAQTYAFADGDFHAVEQMETLGTSKNDRFLNGQLMVSPDVIPYRNEANLTRGCLRTFQKIRREFIGFKEKFFEGHVKKLWNSKGYSQAQNITLGNQRDLYRNLYRKTADGKIDPNLVFEDPDDMTNNLTNEERSFLREVLWIINRRRFKLEKYDRNSDVVKEKKRAAGQKWFWVPVQEAAGGSKINSEYFVENIIREAKEIISLGKRSKEAFRRSDTNTYTESEYKAMTHAREREEVFSRYSVSEDSQEERTKLLQSQPAGFWETNVENIVLSYELTHIRKQELDNVLPHIKVMKFLIEAWGYDANINTDVNIEYLENFEKQAIHNITLLSDQEQEYTHLVKKAKMAASYSMIVGNVIAPIRDTLEGIWKGIEIFVADTWGKYRGFDRKDFIKAYSIVLDDSLHGYSGITVLEALNQRFGISDMDYQLLDKKAKSGKTGLFNFSDKLWWTSTAGDYTNRMVILVAKMLHDGSFYACTYEGGFKYDMAKDERFKVYMSGNTNDPKYNEQKGLYLTMLAEFNEAGYGLKEGDALPEPYTPNEIVNLKTFADRLYGYYDHDSRIQLEKHALGSIFLQFCTYLTGSKTQWFLSPDQYETNIREQGKDAEGNLLYWQRVTDSEGNPTLTIGTTPTDAPYYPTSKSYMEGIYYTLRNFCRDVKNVGTSGAVHNIMECKAKQQNLRALGYKLAMWVLLGGIVKSLLDMWKDERKKDKSPYTVSKALADEGFNIFYRGVNGSGAAFNLIEAFGGDVISSEPPAFGMMVNMVNSTFGVGKAAVTGNDFGKSLESWIYTNSAAYRSTSELWRGLSKIGKAADNTVSQ